MNSIVNGLMNLLLVSIPEESIWVITTLIFLKRFDLLDKYRWKENIKWIAIPVLLSSISINILRYINTPRLIISLLAVLTIYLGIILILKSSKINILNESIPYIKTFLFVLLTAIVIILTESLYAPFLIVYVKESILQINNLWAFNFLLSIPARLTQLFVVLIILSIQNKQTYLHIFQSMFSEKKISIAIISFISIMIFFWVVLIDIFGNYSIISQFKLTYRILLNISIFIIPSVLLALMVYIIILFIEKINQIQKSHQNMFDILDDDI